LKYLDDDVDASVPERTEREDQDREGQEGTNSDSWRGWRCALPRTNCWRKGMGDAVMILR
jgi:hypothetical protein